jgi:cytochrome c biogenesis protein CcmG/thiol:disulfide interchange protein DsbE
MSMGASTRFLIPLGIFLALAALLFYGLGTDPRKVPSPLVGKPAPEFTLPVLNDPGRTLTDAQFKGKVSLLNVWASWCSSCRAEHAELLKLSREQEQVQVLGLNWKDEAADATRMLQMTGDPYVVSGYDPDNDVGIDWGVYGAPETFVVDSEGIICYKKIGPIEPGTWEAELAPTVNWQTLKCKEQS